MVSRRVVDYQPSTSHEHFFLGGEGGVGKSFDYIDWSLPNEKLLKILYEVTIFNPANNN